MAFRKEGVDSNLVCGYTTQDHLLLDLDKISYMKAHNIVCMIQRSFLDVGTALLVHSSCWHYHVVFDNCLRWERIVSIIQTLAALNVVEPNYLNVRSFRRDLTLRVSPKHGQQRDRHAPEVVELIRDTFGSAPHYGITKYLHVLGVFRKMEKTDLLETVFGELL
jgi:hypothetical protein